MKTLDVQKIFGEGAFGIGMSVPCGAGSGRLTTWINNFRFAYLENLFISVKQIQQSLTWSIGSRQIMGAANGNIFCSPTAHRSIRVLHELLQI